jgi:hypothetical protein
LPVLSDLASLLKQALARQFNLAYVLLHLCPTCEALGIELSRFGEIDFCQISSRETELLTRAFLDIDNCCGDLPNAYLRREKFTQAFSAVHNEAFLRALSDSVPCASVRRSDVSPHINVENTLLQVMVKDFQSDWNADFLTVGMRIVDSPSYPSQGIYFYEGQDWDFPKRIALYESGADISGFKESIFKESLKRVRPTTEHMPHLYDSFASMHQAVPLRTPPKNTAGILLVLAMLQEFDCGGLKGLSEQFMEFCEFKSESGERDWKFLYDGRLTGRLRIDDWAADRRWSESFLERLMPLIDEMRTARNRLE